MSTTIQGSYYGKLMDMDYLPTVTTDGRPNIFVKMPYTDEGLQLALCEYFYKSIVYPDCLGFCMNTSLTMSSYSTTNENGWAGSLANTDTVSQLLALMPSDYQAIITEANIYTDNVGLNTGSVLSNVTKTKNKIFYLSEYEMFGTITKGNAYEANFQKQLRAYANGLDMVHYKHDSQSTKAEVWFRSPASTSRSNFVGLSTGGICATYIAYYAKGACPCFLVA